jgi:hypothetical protein
MPDHVKDALAIARKNIDEAAAKAHANPSDAQKEAGNYKVGRVRWNGLDISIENPKGSKRSGVSKNGHRWSVRLPAHYGYIRGTEGRDGDHVDIYMGPDPHSDRVYVVDQVDARTKKADEHKVMLGFSSEDAARSAYERGFSDGRGKDRIGAMKQLSVDQFKGWLKSGDTKSPIARQKFAAGGSVMPFNFNNSWNPWGGQSQYGGWSPLATGGAQQQRMPWGGVVPNGAMSWGGQSQGWNPKFNPQAQSQPSPFSSQTGGFIPTAQQANPPAPAPSSFSGGMTGAANPPPTMPNNALQMPSAGANPPPQQTGATSIGWGNPQVQTFNSAPPQQTGSVFGPGRANGGVADPMMSALDVAREARRRARGGSVGHWMEQSYSSNGIDPPKVNIREGEGYMPRYADGGDVDVPVPEVVDPVTPILDKLASRERLAIQRRAMAGREPILTDDERADIERRLPLYDDTAQKAERLSGEMTGIPSVLRGLGNIKRGYDEGDVVRGIGGAGEAVLGALPAAGATRAGVAAMRPFFSSAPRAAATMGALAVPGAYANEAEAADASVSAAVNSDPEVKRLREKIESLRALRTQKSTEPIRGLNPANSEAARARAGEQIQSDIDTTQQELKKAEQVARDSYLSNAPFRERNPGVAPALLYAGLGVAGGVPLAKEIVKGAGDRLWRGPELGRAAAKFEDLLGTGQTAKAALAQDVLRRKVASWDAAHGAPAAVGTAIGNAAKGAIVASEASALPEQIDYVSFNPGHPTRERAVTEFAKPEYYLQRAIPAALGAGTAVSAQTVGSLLSKYQNPHIENAKALAAIGGTGTPAQRVREMIGLEDRSTNAVKRLRDFETAMSPVSLREKDRSLQVRSGDQQRRDERLLEREASALEGSAGTRSAGSPSAPSAVGPETSLVPNTPIRRSQTVYSGVPEGPQPRVESSGSQALEAPKSYYRYKDRLGRTVHKDEETHQFVADPRKPKDISDKEPTRKALTSDEPASRTINERSKADPVKKSKTEVTAEEYLTDKSKNLGGMADGGVIDRALSIAGRYNNGGMPHVGPVVGETGGRDDELPVEVPSGSFIVPADVVAALGQGNSLAGFKALDKTFGKQRHAMAAGGAAVPILISDGEYAISPETVAKIGNGDMDLGHKSLDKLVGAIRQQHIAQLKSLPPPAR